MIVSETPTAYRFVTQPNHAALAGQFADHWGGEGFERPEPYPAIVAAAYTHDNGWWPYDRQPRLADDGSPVNFTELPPQTWIELYDRGIEAVVGLDRYAAILVSLHGTGLRRRRYGLSPAWPDTPAAFADFVARQEARQRELFDELDAEDDDRITDSDDALLSALHESGTPSAGTSSRLWTNYALLQAWDSLSLSFCTTVTPPADDELRRVPKSPGGPTVTLSITPLDDAAVSLGPYPFATDPLEVQVSSRTVEKAAFDTEAELFEAYYSASLEAETYSLRSGG